VCCAPAFPLSLLPSFQVSLPLLTPLQSVAVKYEDEGSLPMGVEGQKVELASCLLCTCIQKAGGEYTFTLLMKLKCPQWLTGILTHLCILPPWHSDICPSVSTRVFSWPLFMVPTCDPGMSTSKGAYPLYTMYNRESCCLSSLIDQ